MVCALLGRARRARGCVTPGDDRLETRFYAVKRYLFRLGHAASSARYATSVEQLVVGLAAVMGWGPIPLAERERARFVRAHRRSVQRWLDDLQAAGLVAHEPERDGDGLWWRTQIRLLAAPAVDANDVRHATLRARGWRARERARRRTSRVSPALGTIRAHSGVPGALLRARVARDRATAAQRARRVAAVESQLPATAALRAGSGLLAHPFGAPPAAATELVSAGRVHQAPMAGELAPPPRGSAPTPRRVKTVVEGTGARACPPPAEGVVGRYGNDGECFEEIATGPREHFEALVRLGVDA